MCFKGEDGHHISYLVIWHASIACKYQSVGSGRVSRNVCPLLFSYHHHFGIMSSSLGAMCLLPLQGVFLRSAVLLCQSYCHSWLSFACTMTIVSPSL